MDSKTVAIFRGLPAQIPIVYFTQLLGLALGQDEGSLGLDKNLFDVRQLLREKWG
ncbi:MAG: hypothetical protein HZB80_07695 [Deltaproteobacteria bacterium]|nr:hypothetical protein [Deltaproteobacteria bacterium]